MNTPATPDEPDASIRGLLDTAAICVYMTAAAWVSGLVIPVMVLVLAAVGAVAIPMSCLLAMYAYFRSEAMKRRAALLVLSSVALMAAYYGTLRNLGGP